VCDRLFDELIDGIGTEQSPPIPLDLSAEGNVLQGIARGVAFAVQGIACIARSRRSRRSREMGSHGATAQA
jgi:hypothetical protein